MRKIALSLNIFLVAILAVGISLTSCKKDDFTEEDAINLHNNLETEDFIAEYTVIVVDAATNNWLKSASAIQSLEGAQITLTQGALEVSKMADSLGMAIFTGIKAGLIGVNVRLAGYSEVNYVADLQEGLGGEGMPGGIKQSNIIPMIPLEGASTAILTGSVTYEGNLTNVVPENAATVVVLASVDVGAGTLAGIKTGAIKTITYGDLNMTDTTDANGVYSITVPATANGLTYELSVLDFEAQQTLIMPTYNGVENVGAVVTYARFGSKITNISDIIDVYPAYIIFPAPDHGQVTATATAIIDSDRSIESVNITVSGAEYNVNSDAFVTYVSGPDLVSDYGIITVNLNDFKQVTHATLIGAGENHTSTDNVELGQIIVGLANVADPITGEITGITLPGSPNLFDMPLDEDPASGDDYNTPLDVQDENDVLAITETGNGAEIEFTFTNLGYNDDMELYEFQISGYTINDGGDDYKADDLICFSLDPQTEAVGEANIVASSVVAIEVDETGNGYVSGQVAVLLEGGEGKDATASATVVNGKIAYITVTDAGFGYTTAPDVVIINQVTPKTAPWVYINADEKGLLLEEYYAWNGSSYSLLNLAADPIGAGYRTPVDVDIETSVAGAGTGAVASAQLNASGEITAIIISDPGTGYLGINTPEHEVAPATVTTTVKGAGQVIRDIYLGTGRRIVQE